MKLSMSRPSAVGGVLLSAAAGIAAAAFRPAPSAARPSGDESVRRAKQIVRGFYESYNYPDIEAAWRHYVHFDAVMHAPGHDRASRLAYEKEIVGTFDDFVLTVLDQVAEGEKVATRWHLGGHLAGDIPGVPGPGRYVSMTTTTVDRVHRGKITERWADAEFTALLG
jgi:predicted ester cyclase